MIFIVRDVFIEAATGGVLYKRLFLRISQYSQEATVLEFLFCKGVTQVLSCGYCENIKNSIFEKHLQTVASVFRTLSIICDEVFCKNKKLPLIILIKYR